MFEPLIKDKHLVLAWSWEPQGGFDDLVAGLLAPGSGAAGEQERTNI